jgi:type IV pilus assembly protein PilX
MSKRPQSARTRSIQTQRRGGQRGVTLIIAIIALITLTVGAIAMVRSTSTSLRMSGNLAFKRDLANQSERAVAAALADLRTGSLSSASSRQTNRAASNYSAALLASPSQGIPTVLLDDSAYTTAGFTRTDITDTAAGITIRYVIDRQCSAAGTFDAAACTAVSTIAGDKGGSSQGSDSKAGGGSAPVYRISVRVTGPRGVQSYLQTTVVL